MIQDIFRYHVRADTTFFLRMVPNVKTVGSGLEVQNIVLICEYCFEIVLSSPNIYYVTILFNSI